MIQLFQKWLGRFAKECIRREQPFIIAITGAVGKSTAKEMIGALLKHEANQKTSRISKKNYNNELGVPLTILHSDAPGRSLGAWLWLLQKSWFASLGIFSVCPDILVLEMGADKPGDIKYLTSIAPPQIGVITAVLPEGSDYAPVHRANYASVQDVVHEKAELIRALNSSGTAVLAADDQSVFAMRSETNAHILSYGSVDTADVRIFSSNIALENGAHGKIPTGRAIKVQHWGHIYDLVFPGVFGAPIGQAVASTIAVSEAMDIPSEAIRALTSNFIPMPGRTRIIPGIKYTTLFDDTYNASPVAVISAVRDLMNMRLDEHQRRIVCLGEMRELGKDSELFHKKVAASCARMGVDIFVACGTFSGAMKRSAQEAGMHDTCVYAFEDTPEAGLFLQGLIQSGDIVLAKASQGTHKTKGVRMERVVKELMAEPLRASELLVRQGAVWNRR